MSQNQKPQQKPQQKIVSEPVKDNKAQKIEAIEVDQAQYDRYTDLKFLQLSGVNFDEKTKKEVEQLEIELKKCTGKIAAKTVRAAIKNEQALMVKGIPVPKSIEKLVGKKDAAYYFENE